MRTYLLTLFAFFIVTIAKAQTADEIIAKHIDAVGGKDLIAKITSLYVESSTAVMGNDAPTKTTVIAGKGYKNETDFNGQNIVQAVTDKSGWMINPFAGASDATAMSDDDFKIASDDIYLPDPLINYAANGAKVELIGQEKIGEINAYKIKYTNKYNAETVFYIDPATYYVIETVKKGMAMGQEVTVITTLSDYQKTDYGIFMPYAVNIDMGQFTLDITRKKVEINGSVDEKIFDMPGK
ncbi:outer membrane lipoprotein-sorting protein [Panacibacter ginsenosidivorans]|uniref:Outer membrane lipoprotein-sorting protein n=1 Tax=Panacibacter ginsenosidivorans TaxID=1813871 RepID=A0A5B8V7H4_9BACT|nr:outer membrane lipoprotein-sorting protein [Panacibacter ginsenosidivorans]QEC66873.1 outer membrane lipoprotein-sorting protein [Panacibacter ginsenosidivorans]